MSQNALVLNEPLSPPRIGGVAAAIAIHIVAFMLLMVPMTYAPQMDIPDDTPWFLDPVVPKIEEVKPPPPKEVKIVEKKPEIVPLVNKPIVTPEVVPDVIYNDAGANATPYVPPTEVIGGGTQEVIAPPSGPISLSTEFAPAPNYPKESLRNGDEGTVILLVKVDALGRPIEATIQKSSGHRELDRAAKKHLLDTWRFHPAMHQGLAIPALALVPVEFKIN